MVGELGEGGGGGGKSSSVHCGKYGARTGLALTVRSEVGEVGREGESSSVHLQWHSSSSSMQGGPAGLFPLPTMDWFLDAGEPEESRDVWSWRRMREQREQVWCGRGVLGFPSS